MILNYYVLVKLLVINCGITQGASYNMINIHRTHYTVLHIRRDIVVVKVAFSGGSRFVKNRLFNRSALQFSQL